MALPAPDFEIDSRPSFGRGFYVIDDEGRRIKELSTLMEWSLVGDMPGREVLQMSVMLPVRPSGWPQPGQWAPRICATCRGPIARPKAKDA